MARRSKLKVRTAGMPSSKPLDPCCAAALSACSAPHATLRSSSHVAATSPNCCARWGLRRPSLRACERHRGRRIQQASNLQGVRFPGRVRIPHAPESSPYLLESALGKAAAVAYALKVVDQHRGKDAAGVLPRVVLGRVSQPPHPELPLPPLACAHVAFVDEEGHGV